STGLMFSIFLFKRKTAYEFFTLDFGRVLSRSDRIAWGAKKSEGARTGGVVAPLPRHSLLARPDVHLLQPKPVAANIDRIIIVIAPEPQPFANLIDRYLVAAEAVDIPPLLLLNKSDLLTPANSAEIDSLLERYRAIGYPVLRASIQQERGLAELLALL